MYSDVLITRVRQARRDFIEEFGRLPEGPFIIYRSEWDSFMKRAKDAGQDLPYDEDPENFEIYGMRIKTINDTEYS